MAQFESCLPGPLARTRLPSDLSPQGTKFLGPRQNGTVGHPIAVVLISMEKGYGTSSPQGTFGKAWRHFQLSWLGAGGGGRCCWHLVVRGQAVSQHPTKLRTGSSHPPPISERIIWTQILTALRLRILALDIGGYNHCNPLRHSPGFPKSQGSQEGPTGRHNLKWPQVKNVCQLHKEFLELKSKPSLPSDAL